MMFFFLLAAPVALAQVQYFEVPVQKPALPPLRTEAGRLEIGPLKKTGLGKKMADIQTAELEKKYTSCLEKSLHLEKQAAEIQVWVMRRALRCLESAAMSPNWNSKGSIENLWRILDNRSLFFGYKGSEALAIQAKSTVATIVDQMVRQNKPQNQMSSVVERLLGYGFDYSKKDLAVFLSILAENAFRNQNLDASQNFFLRSLALNENLSVRRRSDMVASLNQKKKGSSDLVVLQSSDEDKLATDSDLKEIEGAEREIIQRFDQDLAKSDWVPAVEDGVEYLRRFPFGGKASFVREKIGEVFSSLMEKTDATAELMKSRLITILEGAEPQLIWIWLQQGLRAGLYCQSAQLADIQLKKMRETELSSKMIYFAGRSFQHCGRLEPAKVQFRRLTTTSAPEAQDARIQLALIAIRESEWATAVSYLERARIFSVKGSSQALVIQYWLWQALKKIDANRAVAVANELIKQFPLSYYGIRAAVELKKEGFQVPIKATEVKSVRIFSTTAERKTFDRVLLLAQSGWTDEAVIESKALPEPLNSNGRLYFSQLLSQIGDMPRAVAVFQRGFETEGSGLPASIIKAVFPKLFFESVLQEAEIRKIDPYIVQATMRQESLYMPTAISRSGAVGLMQLMPDTAKEVQEALKLKSLLIPEDLKDGRRNISLATYYLSQMIKTFAGNVPLALAAYNAGPTRLRRWIQASGRKIELNSDPVNEIWIDELPWDETQVYVKAILRNQLIYRALDNGKISATDPLWTVKAD